jgi:penicillin amidase
MKYFRFLVLLSVNLILIYVLNSRTTDVPILKNIEWLVSLNMPPMGKFLNPFGGFWSNAEPKKPSQTIKLQLPQLQDKVEIFLDNRLVPHIFAQNEADLYFAQGYIMAKYRLWQMEFITHAAAGRVSEILGKRALAFDLLQRRIGMVYAAEKAYAEAQKDKQTFAVLQAYTDGVNAYINQLAPSDYPLEYKLLSYAPEAWSPFKCTLVMKYMAKELAYRNDDLAMTNILAQHGTDVVNELFRAYSSKQSPIIPEDTRFDFKPLSIPKIPKEVSYLKLSEKEKKARKQADRKGIGSNNWAVGADRSATGYPILANDPHLALNLPSIWFEVQLVAPKLNVYGVTIPGGPGVTIGFNQEIAWGVTNVDSDVQDWYKVQFKDSQRSEYFHNKAWKKLTTRLEKIKIRDGQEVIDTILFTHQGPIVALAEDSLFAQNNAVPTDCAFKWLAHEPSNELVTFYKLNRAKNYDDYRKAISTYACPAQNFVFADVHKDIAITPNGKFPVKWRGQGKFVLDGSNPEHDWSAEYIPANQNPHVKNPPRGFVSSANQFSVVDSLYPYYLHWEFAPYERGARINNRLAQMEKANADSMRRLQNDALGLSAQDALPAMLKYMKDAKFKGEEAKALKELQNWNYHFTATQIAPTIYKLWWRTLVRQIWGDEFGEGMRYPVTDKTVELVIKGDSIPVRWFDNVKTPQKETLADLVQASFAFAVDSLTRKHGKIGEQWQWAKVRGTVVQHLLRQKSFSVPVFGDGDGTTVNATNPTTGPSWRMIVELGRTPKAYGIYPGGQSGNPGSHYYANFINAWSKGELATLLIMKKPEKTDRIVSYVKMSK